VERAYKLLGHGAFLVHEVENETILLPVDTMDAPAELIATLAGVVFVDGITVLLVEGVKHGLKLLKAFRCLLCQHSSRGHTPRCAEGWEGRRVC